MSGFLKSSSWRPEARSMARAPARLAPSIRARLRGLGKESLTAESLRCSSAASISKIANPEKDMAIILVWMMALESCGSWLRPPSSVYGSSYVVNSYGHTAYDSDADRNFVAVRDGGAEHNRHQSTGSGAGSQSVKLIVVADSIRFTYCLETCSTVQENLPYPRCPRCGAV